MSARKCRGARNRERRDTRPLLVTTSLGNCILPRDCTVLVRLGENEFARKAVEDLREGEKVLYEKQGIDVGEQKANIDRLLGEGKRYRSAMSSLFTQAGGRQVPVFRSALLEGIMGKPGEWPKELAGERKRVIDALDKGAGLETEGGRLAAEAIRAALEAEAGLGAKPVSLEQIESGWLAGNVIAPRSFGAVFWALGRMAPGLVGLLATPEFERDYFRYRAIRMSIMLRLSNIIKGEGNGGRDSPAAARRGRSLDAETRRELDGIVEFFAQDVDTRYAAASVVSAMPIKQAEGSQGGRNSPALRKGVVTKRPQDAGFRILAVQEVQERINILEDVFDTLWHLYLHHMEVEQRAGSREMAIEFLAGKLGYEGADELYLWALKKARNSHLDEEAITCFQQSFGPGADRRDQEGFFEALRDGKLDAVVGLESGACLKVVEELVRHRAMEPREAFYTRRLFVLHKMMEGKKGANRVDVEAEKANDELGRKGYVGFVQTPRRYLQNVFLPLAKELDGPDMLEAMGMPRTFMMEMFNSAYTSDYRQAEDTVRRLLTCTWMEEAQTIERGLIKAESIEAALAELGLLEIAKRILDRYSRVGRKMSAGALGINKREFDLVAGYALRSLEPRKRKPGSDD